MRKSRSIAAPPSSNDVLDGERKARSDKDIKRRRNIKQPADAADDEAAAIGKMKAYAGLTGRFQKAKRRCWSVTSKL